MHSFRLNFKRISIWILLLFQVLIVTSYFYLQSDRRDNNLTSHSVTFFKYTKNDSQLNNITYHTKFNKLMLKNVYTRDSYMDFNTSLCYINGTDVKSMKRSNDIHWQCICLPGWHGSDCGQPEVIWRAFLSYRKPISIKGPRKYERRIIYIIEVNEYLEVLTDIRVNELKDCVDLFVLYENNSNFLENKLNNRFLKPLHYKILYLNVDVKMVWSTVKNMIANIEDDDIILTSSLHEIPNSLGMTFFKFYNDWPEPINFRLKYSIYGFFWIHPSKTVLSGSACTVHYLYESLNDDLVYLNSNKTLSNLSSKNFIIGDLNHYGGWFCEYCNDPSIIINHLANQLPIKPIVWENINKIDSSYIENLIENGLYLDGKTELVKAHRFHENYFAPIYVKENSWKYDFLLVNMFSKMDYYE